MEGTATGTDPRSFEIGINVADASPAAPDLLTPADGALNVNLRPTFSWNPSPQASSYEFQLATDAGFTNILLQQTVAGTMFSPATDLPSGTELFWHVTAKNQCGPGPTSATFSFVTLSEAGECGPGSQPDVYFEDESFEDGPWHIDDVVVQSCEASTVLFMDGFEDW